VLDIINPWGALRRAKIVIAYQAARISDLYEDLDAANAKIAQGHFRNPKTGRIGREGETFQ